MKRQDVLNKAEEFFRDNIIGGAVIALWTTYFIKF